MGGDERWYGAADKIVEAIREAEYMSVGVALVAATRHAIARVLAEVAVPPKGHIKDETGVVRKVLGTLPVTADGCVIGDGCKVFYKGHMVNAEPMRSSCPGESDWHAFLCHKAYSTPEAAERAGKEATS